jgi:cytoskeleton protein RodZ
MTSQKELIPMLPGDILRYEREKKSLNLEQAAERSGIKASVLSAIESGDTGEIPSVYLRGYIRNYARFLGIPGREIEEYMEHVHGATPEVRSIFSVKSSKKQGEKWLKASSYLAASLLIAALAWQFTHEAVRFSQGESGLKSAERDGPAPQAPEPSDTEVSSQPANTHLNASIASVEILKQRAEMASGSVAEDAWAALGEAEDALAGAEGHRLTITTSADTWVEIFGSGDEQLEMDLIRAGSVRDYKGPGPFRVMIGRASAVELVLDGEPVDLAPHTRGNVAHITLGESPEIEQ